MSSESLVAKGPARLVPPRSAHRKDAPTITGRGLWKSFGDRLVISGLDLNVPAGQFLAIVGRSGCGKSTLLRLLAGLEHLDSGTLRIGNGAAFGGARLMFQEPRLLPWARVIANVAVGLDPESGSSRDPRTARAQCLEALRDVGLEDRADQWPSTLSGGQKQRVALARALVSRPSFLALDEPLGALDALTRIEMQQLIERVFEREGFTAVLVTHDVSEAVALADRVVVLEDGAITSDVMIDLPRPRRRGSPEAALLESRILTQLLGEAAA
jgi:sulfonate transport system ATP-binding protein